MPYPAGLQSIYHTEAEYCCPACAAQDEDYTGFTVEGTVDLNQFEPDSEPCCPACGSYRVDYQN